MSKLRVRDDDHPEAAGKHLHDASVLLDVFRYDSAAYLSGYVVECALKAVLLHDKSFDPATRTHDPATLADFHRSLARRPYGHDLLTLASVTVSPQNAKYLIDLPPGSSIFEWRETLRYAGVGFISEPKARAFCEWAELLYSHSIVTMRQDGVL